MQKFLLFIVVTLSSGLLYAQSDRVFSLEDEAIFEKYAQHIQPYREQPIETVLEKTAEFFLGSPYVGHTLEVTENEQLIVNLREFDCVTYIENVIALSLTAKSSDLSFENFTDKLRDIRYRNGEIGDYSTRVHYTSDWVFNNEEMGFLRNVSNKLNGVKETKRINFMSSHRSSYKQLKSDDSMLKSIELMENNINSRDGFYYVPKSEIENLASEIPHMAMIGFTTAIDGLDTTHTGFTYKKDGKLTFIHASSVEEKIVIDKKTLSDYCNSQKNCTGVIIAVIM